MYVYTFSILTKLRQHARDDSTNQERKPEEGSLSTKKMTSQYLALEVTLSIIVLLLLLGIALK